MDTNEEARFRIRVIAPGAAVNRHSIDFAAKLLTTVGHTVTYGENLFSRYRYFAGSLEARLRDFADAANDDAVDVIWFARGGMGCAQLLPHIGGLSVKKPVVGYSDNSSLLHHVWLQKGIAVHGPVFEELGVEYEASGEPEENSARSPSLRADALESIALLSRIRRLRKRRSFALHPSGKVPAQPIEGFTRGGNLATIASLIGTPWQPSFRDAVVLLEDIGEPYYRLERMLFQLIEGGALDGAKAVCLGDFHLCPRREVPHSIEQIFAEYLDALDIPLFSGLPFGHGDSNRPWIVGASARIQQDELVWAE